MARTKSPTSNKPKSNNEELNDEFTPEPRESKDSTAAIRNKKKLEQDGSYIEMPEVSDIPGQENVRNAGVPGEMADTTISSDDEEGVRGGKDVLEGEEDDLGIVMGTEADVTRDDLVALGDKETDLDNDEDERIPREGLDDVDTDGDPLNEGASNISSTGEDLDIPNDDEDEDEMEEDEENDYYSLGGDEKDDNDNGTPNEYRDRE